MSAVAYREKEGSSSEDEGEIFDDDEEEQKTTVPVVAKISPNSRKMNNVWSSVLTEQSSNEISSMVGNIGGDKMVSRGPESFDLALAIKDKNNEQVMEYSNLEKLLNERKKEILNTIKAEKKNERSKKHVPKYKMGQKVTLNRKCEISAEDDIDKVSEEIAFRLWEPKRDLIKSIIEAIGVEKAIEIYQETEQIESNGGLLTLRGDRRRTPGGTFICKLREAKDVDKEMISEILQMQNQKHGKRKIKQTDNSFGPTVSKQIKTEIENQKNINCNS